MELSKRRRVLRALPFIIGLLTMAVGFSISDPGPRHIVAGFGVAVLLVGAILNIQTMRSMRP
jgi:hypothetical protein